jgi:hypothetical protein
MRRWPTLLIFVSTAITTQKSKLINILADAVYVMDIVLFLNTKNNIITTRLTSFVQNVTHRESSRGKNMIVIFSLLIIFSTFASVLESFLWNQLFKKQSMR